MEAGEFIDIKPINTISTNPGAWAYDTSFHTPPWLLQHNYHKVARAPHGIFHPLAGDLVILVIVVIVMPFTIASPSMVLDEIWS